MPPAVSSGKGVPEVNNNPAGVIPRGCALFKEHGIAHDEVVYVGDDYGPGGNDESVYLSDFNYITIDDYLDFPNVVKVLLD